MFITGTDQDHTTELVETFQAQGFQQNLLERSKDVLCSVNALAFFVPGEPRGTEVRCGDLRPFAIANDKPQYVDTVVNYVVQVSKYRHSLFVGDYDLKWDTLPHSEVRSCVDLSRIIWKSLKLQAYNERARERYDALLTALSSDGYHLNNAAGGIYCNSAYSAMKCRIKMDERQGLEDKTSTHVKCFNMKEKSESFDAPTIVVSNDGDDVAYVERVIQSVRIGMANVEQKAQAAQKKE